MKDYDRQPYIYFARVGKYLKVGYSRDPQRRIKSLKAARLMKPADFDMTAPVDLLLLTEGGALREMDAHATLADFRVTGEWFAAEPQLIANLPRFARGAFPRIRRTGGPIRDLADSA